MVKVDLTNHNKTLVVRGYYAFTTGKWRDEHHTPCELILSYHQYVSGCNPYVWEVRKSYHHLGHGFKTKEHALEQTKYAAKNFEVFSIDEDSIEIVELEFTTVSTAKII